MHNIGNTTSVIRSRKAITFLKRFGIRPIEVERATGQLDPIQEPVAGWRQQAVRIECLGR
ncbi:MAG: hypothetical protein AB8B71_15910 [Paracoccaceae bacterium]